MKRILIAKIATAHGIKGLVKLQIMAENLDLFHSPLYTGADGNDTLQLTLKNPTGKYYLAALDGITDRNAAENLRGTKLYIDRDTLPDIDNNEFYHVDMIGLPCIDPHDKEIGKIIAIPNFGAGDLLEIKPSQGPSFYLPFNNETVPKIERDKIHVTIPEGLME